MSRIANQVNLGYVPTPPKALSIVTNHLNTNRLPAEDPAFNLLDPCCGEGSALRNIASQITHIPNIRPGTRYKGNRVVTYGVELHEERALMAGRQLSRTINTDIAMAEIAHNSMDFMWLNPPYDHHPDHNSMEQYFLFNTTKYLKPSKGVLAFCIPRHKLADSAQFLVNNYRNITAMTFPEEEYEQYKQIIIMAHKRYSTTNLDWSTRDHTDNMIRWAESNKMAPYPIPIVETARIQLNASPTNQYFIQPTLQYETILFKKASYDIEKAKRDTASIFKSDEFLNLITPNPSEKIESVTNIRNSHVVQLIASGALNNTIMPDGTIIKGSSSKVVSKEQEFTGENIQITETERSKTNIIELNTNKKTWEFTEYTNMPTEEEANAD